MGYDSLTAGKVFLQCFGMFGRTACTAFMLMTGYYSCMFVRNDHWRRIVPLASQAVFWSLALHFLLPPLFGVDTWHYRPHEWLYAVCPFLSGGGIWFVTQYIAFWCFVPVVNPMLGALSRRQFHLLFLLFGLFWILPGTLLPSRMQPEWSFGGMAYFFFVYSIGAYIKKHPPQNYGHTFVLSRKRMVLLAISSVTAMVCSVIALDAAGVVLKTNQLIHHAMHFCIESSILSIFCAVSLFLLFQGLDFRSRFINWIASSVLGIYLIHALCPHTFIWHGISPITEHTGSLASHALIKCLVVFLCCLVLDKIRHYTIGRIGRYLLHSLWPNADI